MLVVNYTFCKIEKSIISKKIIVASLWLNKINLERLENIYKIFTELHILEVFSHLYNDTLDN